MKGFPGSAPGEVRNPNGYNQHKQRPAEEMARKKEEEEEGSLARDTETHAVYTNLIPFKPGHTIQPKPEQRMAGQVLAYRKAITSSLPPSEIVGFLAELHYGEEAQFVEGDAGCG